MFASSLLVMGCGGGGSGDSSPSAQPQAMTPRPVAQSDLEIASALYDGRNRTPAGFYAESAPSGHAVVATAHVKNTDLDSSLSESTAQFELCTDDWHQALGWSETSALNSPQYANLVATNDDERYFEFGRMKPGSPPVYVQSRIYKCAYLNRSAANLRAAVGPAGQLNVRPLTSDELRRLSEYFWQFTPFNNFGHVVLKSSGADGAHTLQIASLVRGATSGACDRVDVIAWTHRVDVTTGNLVLQMQNLFSFSAQETSGVAQLCH